MENYLLQVKDEESLLAKFRRIVKEELTGVKSNKKKEENDEPQTYIKVDEVCKILQISRPTVNDWTSKGYFRKYKVNSRTFYNREEILEFLSKQGL